MEAEAATTEARRTWQEVAQERGIPLRILGDLLGKTYNTMLAYSMGRRVPPEEVLRKLRRVLGEDVQ